MRQSSTVDWNTLRAAYEAGVPVVQICSENNISRSKFYYWARKQSWTLARSVTPDNYITYQKKRLLERMFYALEGKVRQIEERIREQPHADPTEASLDAKTLRSLLDMYDKLDKLDAELADKLNKKEGPDEYAPYENEPAEQLREELAERLAQLQPKGD